MKKEELKINICLIIAFVILGFSPILCRATSNSVEIHNEVNVSANTGGNVISGSNDGGQIIEGQSRSEVHTETIINGETVESTDIHSTSTTNSEVGVKEEIEADGGEANIHQEIEINGEKKVEDREIELENATTFTTTIESCTPTDDNDDETPMATKTATETRGLEKEIENNIFDSIHNFVTELLNGLKSLFQNIFRF